MKNTSPVLKESRILLAISAIGCAGRASALRFVLANVQSLFRVIAIQRLYWYRSLGNKTRLFLVYYLSHRAPEDMRLPKHPTWGLRQWETYTCFGIHRSASNLDSSVLCNRVPGLLNLMKCGFAASALLRLPALLPDVPSVVACLEA
jgi:hypothetical protein